MPAMADAIWNRIEAVLDVEMPVNQNPQQAPSRGNSFLNNPVSLIIGAGIIAIIITLFILYRHNKTQAPPTTPPVPQQILPAPSPEISPQKDSALHDTPHAEQSKQSEKEVFEKRTVDTAHYTPLLDKRDSAAKLTKDSLRVPTTIKPSIGIMQNKKYGVEVPDTGYRMTTERKE